MIGRTILHYRVTGALGKGGMGVVYEGTDLRLNRLVALKFLPENWAQTPASLERFLKGKEKVREAREAKKKERGSHG